MKKNLKKLSLNRETLRKLESSGLRWARGGAVGDAAFRADTDGACDTIASCTELAEDCCVTTNL
jgi:hypothetical protein